MRRHQEELRVAKRQVREDGAGGSLQQVRGAPLEAGRAGPRDPASYRRPG